MEKKTAIGLVVIVAAAIILVAVSAIAPSATHMDSAQNGHEGCPMMNNDGHEQECGGMMAEMHGGEDGHSHDH